MPLKAATSPLDGDVMYQDDEVYRFHTLDTLIVNDVVEDSWSADEARLLAALKLTTASPMFKTVFVSVYRSGCDLYDDYQLDRDEAQKEIQKLVASIIAARAARQMSKH